MKNIRSYIDKKFGVLDRRWKSLPLRQQRKLTLYFFLSYFAITLFTLVMVWKETSKVSRKMEIEHITNPVLKRKQIETGKQD
ncbi:nitrogen regulatory IIA protein [Chryseobacterium defluvii]|uniref:Nitrogen regulatory IIA protein n=1 Tax=Chryseobacterium defluvii TaxID=160396 RepID=A0A495SP23_9FLAO|nr:nitrogen regulatory IIA protein [Chryseobacterium defluvii]RKT01787.1 hypothetical protein BCF58_1012 [Chryseobacterium defluvii]